MWFQKKKSSPLPSKPSTSAPSVPSVPSSARNEASSSSVHQQTVHLLEQRLRKLEDQLADLSAKHPRIHIDNLHVHQPVLENLTFRLDQLDIKELSGSLNLGNNFGAKPNTPSDGMDKPFQRATVSKEAKTDSPSREASDATSASQADSGPERTSTGYRYTPPQSKA